MVCVAYKMFVSAPVRLSKVLNKTNKTDRTIQEQEQVQFVVLKMFLRGCVMNNAVLVYLAHQELILSSVSASPL